MPDNVPQAAESKKQKAVAAAIAAN